MSGEHRHRQAGRLGHVAHAATPWGFPILYLGWAFLFWAPIVVSDESVWSFPNVGLFLVGGLSPLLAGLLLAWLTRGWEGLRDLGTRLIEVGRIEPRWWLVIVLYWPLFNLLLAGGALLFGVTAEPLEFISTDRLFDPVALFSLVAFAFVFPVVEEIGLRGYWLDRLQERWSALVAGTINGTAWAIWHAPFVLFSGYYANTTFEPELSWFVPMLVLDTIILVWVYNNTRRSILAVLMFHALGNMTGELMGFAPEMYPFILSGYALVAVVLVAGWSPESLRGWGVQSPLAETTSWEL
ncbi:CPBP family intramembrane glutamic endopeptidase [Halapricum hydrolyticum]|uniref:CPBP family intramembrane metalloprotease n=1 Tax=Halapricum hydrolyticum TaxID=2979991 RepID=A0AAE3IAT7_9EURY|nr:type II CAAX endopeptidase family protein [Halapricum hydrolyticum]MCU4716702.1 CPBP family intramembrane metalloprotease [Halapricum hydrolyticum]MCU4725693.1 CPBP family intramembrane metalloprotease [Halapricum hydrolyticum]